MSALVGEGKVQSILETATKRGAVQASWKTVLCTGSRLIARLAYNRLYFESSSVDLPPLVAIAEGGLE